MVTFPEPAPTRVLEITHEDVRLALIHVKSLESQDDASIFTAGADDLIREQPKVAAYALYLLHLNPHNKRKWHLLQLAMQQRDPAKWEAITKAMPDYT